MNFHLVSLFFVCVTFATEYTGAVRLKPGKNTLVSQICIDQDEWYQKQYKKVAMRLQWYVSPQSFVKYGVDQVSNAYVMLTYEAMAIPWIKFINPNTTKNTYFIKNNTIKMIDTIAPSVTHTCCHTGRPSIRLAACSPPPT